MADNPTYEELQQQVRKLKRAENELVKTKALLDAVISQSPMPMIVVTSDGTNLIFNEASRKTLGLSYDETAINMKHPDMKKSWQTYNSNGSVIPIEQAPILKTLKNETTKNKEIRIVRKDGIEKWLVIDAVPVYQQGDNVIAGFAVFQDITERKRAEGALRKSEEKYRNLLNMSPDPIAIVQNNRHMFINQAHTDLFGYTIQDVKNGLSSTQVIPEKDREITLRQISHMIAGKKIDSKYTIVDLVAKDGKIIPCESSGNLIEYEGQSAGMVIIRDITERKQAEEALKKRDEELENKAKDLEELNAALNVLLNKREGDKIKLEDNILLNVRTLIEPYLTKLKTRLPQEQKTLLNILESNLSEIISPFTRKLSSKYLGLTPSEIQVANLVKHGKTNKEIAEILCVTQRTIEFHRENTRKKLGLTNSKTNLKTYLLSID